jgi:hypothetical protein
MDSQIIGELISNAIITTAYIANEMCVQSNGMFLIPETDYLHYVKDFQATMARKIVPIKTTEDFKEEVKKYIREILSKHKEVEDGSESNNHRGNGITDIISDNN